MVDEHSKTPLVNVARFLPEMAKTVPDHPAVRAPIERAAGDRIRYDERSFAQLNRLSDQCAFYLESQGIRRNTQTLLMVKPGLDLILICFALFKIGAIPVVIDPGMGLKRFRECVKRTRPEALIGIPAAILISRLMGGAFKSVGSRISIPRGGKFVRNLEMGKIGDSGTFPMAATQSGDLAAILFTSGSTGPPKGVCYEHGMFEAQVRLIRDHYGIAPGEMDLPMLPIFALFNPAMGMTTVVPEMNPSRPATVDPEKIVQAIQQNHVTNSFGSPVLWRKIGRYCKERSITLPSLKRVLIAGAPVPPDLIRLFDPILPNGEIHTPYGATESLPLTSISGKTVLETTWSQTEEGKGTCVGQVFPEVEVQVIPIEEGDIEEWNPAAVVPSGEIGEICVKGPVVTREYHQLDVATRASKIPDSSDGEIWHRMGDLGYIDTSGWIWFCGRKVERVRAAGGKVYYTDPCEAIFNQDPHVFRTALVGLGAPGAQTPVIVVEPEAGHFPKSKAEQDEFIERLKNLGSQYTVTRDIAAFSFHQGFPVDVRHNAKIHRLTLKRELEAQQRS